MILIVVILMCISIAGILAKKDTVGSLDYESYSIIEEINSPTWYMEQKEGIIEQKEEEQAIKRSILNYEKEVTRKLAVKKAKEERERAERVAREKAEAERVAKEQVEKKRTGKDKQLANRGGSNRTNSQGRSYRVETLIVTAYSPLDDRNGINSQGDPTKTATGTYPQHGTAAVNPNRFPYGTDFYIEGYGEAKALDTGGAMRQNSNKIDIVFPTYESAMNWGVRQMEVIVYED